MIDSSEFCLKGPAYSGSFVRADIIDPLNLSVAHAAEILSSFLNGRSSLSP
jgi:hypothetical protein